MIQQEYPKQLTIKSKDLSIFVGYEIIKGI
jgi:hypothetical protein